MLCVGGFFFSSGGEGMGWWDAGFDWRLWIAGLFDWGWWVGGRVYEWNARCRRLGLFVGEH